MATDKNALAEIADLVHPLQLSADDDLLFYSMSARETLSEPFEFDLQLISLSEKIDVESLLGKPITVKLKLDPKGGAGERHFHGRVARCERVGSMPGTRYYAYRAVLRPWLWFMTLAQDNRVFQKKTVLEIVKAVCDAHVGLGADVVSKLSGTLKPREYCVQYHESDFQFVSRLLEQEGIYYHFEHSASAHKLVLCNAASSHAAQAGTAAKLNYVAGSAAGSKTQFVRGWSSVVQAHSAKATLADFNFETPATKLLSTKSSTHPAAATLEVYDYPARFDASAEGDRYAELRTSEYEARYPVFEGTTDVRAMACGKTFEIASLPITAENGKYLVAQTRTELVEGVHDSSGDKQGSHFECRFEATSTKAVYRTRSRTPKALVHGPQTAFVVGPKGDEIHTDKHGRVKVQFHWDRLGKKDENSSCWVRVSQPWAGKGFGFVQIPRIGDEVVVSFLEGDPDRPLITGRVYNAVNVPPYELTKHATVSGVKTRSSQRGGADTANELRFEDATGEEYIRLQAEKTFYRHVKKNAFDNIVGDDTLTVGGNRYESIKEQQKVEIGQDHWHKVGKDLHVDVGGDIFINTVGAGDLTAGTNLALTAGKEIAVNAGIKLSVEAGMTITLKAGSSFISIGPMGVDISGPVVKINSGGSGGSAKKAKKPKKPDAIKEWKDPMPPKK